MSYTNRYTIQQKSEGSSNLHLLVASDLGPRLSRHSFVVAFERWFSNGAIEMAIYISSKFSFFLQDTWKSCPTFEIDKLCSVAWFVLAIDCHSDFAPGCCQLQERFLWQTWFIQLRPCAVSMKIIEIGCDNVCEICNYLDHFEGKDKKNSIFTLGIFA